MKELVCAHCGAAFIYARKKKYCTPRCGELARSVTGRTVGQLKAETIERRTFTCLCCGKRYVAKHLNRNKYCSRECAYKDRNAWTKVGKKGSGEPKYCKVNSGYCVQCCKPFVSRHRTARCSRECDLEFSKRRYYKQLRVRQPPRYCLECGVWFTPIAGASNHCSHECRKRRVGRASKARRRARIRGVESENFDPCWVFQRDKWKCQLCGRSTPKRLRGTCAPNSPELDHIIPLDKGGPHTRANTQCSCRECNQKKGATPLGQLQLAV